MEKFEPKEGDRGKAPHSGLGRLVEVVYRRQWARVRDIGLDVFTIVGVYEPTGEVLLWPPQATPDIVEAMKAREAKEAESNKDTEATHQPPPAASVGG